MPDSARPITICTDNDAISRNTVEALILILQCERPRIVVEAGTYKASFAIATARTLPDATVYTADVVNHNWQACLKENELPPEQLRFVQEDFEQIVVHYPELVGHVDFAFVDSGWPILVEEPTMRLRHYRAAQRWVKLGGVIAVDDMYGDWPGVQEITQECCIILPTDRGLGLWRKH